MLKVTIVIKITNIAIRELYRTEFGPNPINSSNPIEFLTITFSNHYSVTNLKFHLISAQDR